MMNANRDTNKKATPYKPEDVWPFAIDSTMKAEEVSPEEMAAWAQEAIAKWGVTAKNLN